MSRPFLALVFLVLIFGAMGDALGQSTARKLEVGAQFTSLTLFPPPSDGIDFGNSTEPGVGARVTYNLTDRIAIESELNFFPNRNVFRLYGEGRAIQGQFGVKAGKRFRRFGLFAKARPGFLSIGDVFFFEPGASPPGSGFTNARIARRTHFTTDVGAVLEFYPSGRTMVRFDAGDTIVRYGRTFEPIDFNPAHLTTVPARIKHNFQFTAGVGFRFKDSSPRQSNPGTRNHQKTPKYEAGIQFTSMSFNPARAPCPEICFTSDDNGPITEPGFGGRFGYNLNDYLALEAEGNFFPRQQTVPRGGGRLLQGQFGAKIGKRWERLGIFGKARPGLLSFSKVTQLVGTQQGFFGSIPIEFGIFRVKRKSYFSMDVGGVIEFYMSRRLMTRIDVGDTIVNYSEAAVGGFLASRPIVRRPPETHHNFQFTAGVGFRF